MSDQWDDPGRDPMAAIEAAINAIRGAGAPLEPTQHLVSYAQWSMWVGGEPCMLRTLYGPPPKSMQTISDLPVYYPEDE